MRTFVKENDRKRFADSRRQRKEHPLLPSAVKKILGKIYFKMVRNKHNTPGIIKYPFWQMTAHNPNAIYACLNNGEASCFREIKRRSICINRDVGAVSEKLFVQEVA